MIYFYYTYFGFDFRPLECKVKALLIIKGYRVIIQNRTGSWVLPRAPYSKNFILKLNWGSANLTSEQSLKFSK